jgi:hypothetical protein
MQNEEVYRHDDLTVALDPSGAIHIKAVTPLGDPVELNEEETAELIRVLQHFIKKMC